MKIFFQRKNIDVWTKPLLAKKKGGRAYAIGIMSRRVDGYPYRLGFTLKELNITNTKGFHVKVSLSIGTNNFKQL